MSAPDEESLVARVSVKQWSFPLEIKHRIIDYMAEDKIVSLVKLMLTSKEWYAAIKPDEVGWQRRTLALGDTKLYGAKNWFDRWFRMYCYACRNCGVDASFNDADMGGYLQLEPTRSGITVCSACAKLARFIIESTPSFPFSRLSREEALVIRKWNPISKRHFYFLGDLQDMARAKCERRKQEIRTALSDVPQERVDNFFEAFEEVQDVQGIKDRRLLRHLIKSIDAFFNGKDAPDVEELKSFLDFVEERNSVEESVHEQLEEDEKEELAEEASEALDWLVFTTKSKDESDSEEENEEESEEEDEYDPNERDKMDSWRDAIALGKRTVNEFIKEIQGPSMSHAAYDCSCGGTPALACSNDKCGRCCDGDGCERHYRPPRRTYFRSERYDPYGYSDRFGYDEDEFDEEEEYW